MDHLTQDGPVPDHPAPGPITVVIVDDHQMVLDGLKAMLAPYRDQVDIVGESSDPGRVVRLVGEVKPDAVLLDVRLRGASGLDLCAEILRVTPGCKVVFLTVYDDEQYLYQALRVGAAGWDNALAESFFASLKGELTDLQAWPTRAAARRAIVEYFGWYNGTRLHSTLGYLSPAEYEAATRREDLGQVA
jgi:CheY-like chemotaxis protein